jgi:hypothetical protein
MWKLTLSYHILQCDETPPNSIERKHPRKGEKMKQGARTEQANSPPKAGPLGGNGTTKNQTIAMSI